jgi:MFS transporter, DHA1 family, inner membrane transport protein
MSAESSSPSGRVPLIALTLGKFFLNTILRMPYVFLGDVSRGLKISTVDAGRFIGFGELFGLSSFVIGRDLDSGRHRRWAMVGLAVASLGAALVAFFGVKWALIVGFGGVSVGVSIFTTASHSFFGDQIPVEQRARVIGIYETSWAAALFIGAPLCAILIKRFTWVSPFAVIGVVLAVCVVLIRVRMDQHTQMRNLEAAAHAAGDGESVSRIGIITAVLGSIFLTFGAIVAFSSFGPWLEDRHQLETGGLGAVAFGLGAMELLGSGGTALFSDRIGQRRAVAIGSVLMALGSVILMTGGQNSKVVAVIGILVLFGGFEFAYVSLLSVVSEVGGRHRGTVVAVDHSLVTVTRAIGAGAGPWLAGKQSAEFGRVQVVVIVLALISGVSVLAGGKQQ